MRDIRQECAFFTFIKFETSLSLLYGNYIYTIEGKLQTQNGTGLSRVDIGELAF